MDESDRAIAEMFRNFRAKQEPFDKAFQEAIFSDLDGLYDEEPARLKVQEKQG